MVEPRVVVNPVVGLGQEVAGDPRPGHAEIVGPALPSAWPTVADVPPRPRLIRWRRRFPTGLGCS
jgi:hypothetical protein